MRTQVLLYGILASVLIYTSLHSPSFFSASIFSKETIRSPATQTDRPARGSAKPSDSDPGVYEAITGEIADEDRSVWDSFYKNKNFIFGKDPVSFLKDNIHLIPKGKAFVPAMGEGRNAIFLAKKGFKVDGNDLSEIAIDKALNEARAQKVVINTKVGDLNQYHYPAAHYDFVLVSLFYQRSLAPHFKKTLKKGGYIMFFLRNKGEKPLKDIGPDDFAVNPEELKEDFKEFEIKVYQEFTDHGARVVGLLARKP